MKQQEIIPNVEEKIITLRNQQVILDCDVAELYGVETKRINEAVSNNPEKFPEGYILQLTNSEKIGVVENFDHLKNLRFSPQLPKAFTEKGLYMLATILKSPKAVQTTIAIVEAYAKLKELSRVIVEIPQQEEDTVVQKQLLHRGGQLVEELITDMLPKKSTETSFELNLAMFKFQHSVRRENDEELKHLEQEVERLRNLLDGAGEM
ncbi:MAG: ORF6N domain-containing protein [Bacteroidales bacterium]|nr:ORF6N domain-containing protein [Bacteroidales bacterium]